MVNRRTRGPTSQKKKSSEEFDSTNGEVVPLRCKPRDDIPRADQIPVDLSWGGLYSPAMRVQTQKEADDYLRRLVHRAQVMEPWKTKDLAEEEEVARLHQFAVGQEEDTRHRVARLYRVRTRDFLAAIQRPAPGVGRPRTKTT